MNRQKESTEVRFEPLPLEFRGGRATNYAAPFHMFRPCRAHIRKLGGNSALIGCLKSFYMCPVLVRTCKQCSVGGSTSPFELQRPRFKTGSSWFFSVETILESKFQRPLFALSLSLSLLCRNKYGFHLTWTPEKRQNYVHRIFHSILVVLS